MPANRGTGQEEDGTIHQSPRTRRDPGITMRPQRVEEWKHYQRVEVRHANGDWTDREVEAEVERRFDEFKRSRYAPASSSSRIAAAFSPEQTPD